jgi:hypothetical protein
LLREADAPAGHDQAIAARINHTELYAEAAAMSEVPLPDMDQDDNAIPLDGAMER